MKGDIREALIRLRPGRPKTGTGKMRCDAQIFAQDAWRPCLTMASRQLENGKRVCRACFATAQQRGLPWARAAAPEPQDLEVPTRRRGGPSGKPKAPEAEGARANRRRLHQLMVDAGLVRPADLEASALAAETGEAPPWSYSELARQLQAPRGKVTPAEISGVWRGVRRISAGWTYQGVPLTPSTHRE